MPITEITHGTVSFVMQVCSVCKATNCIPKKSLMLGHSFDGATDPNLIALPVCACGAQEFLNRTFDEAPEDQAAHRRKVNALAVNLKELAQTAPSLQDHFKAEKAEPAQVGELIGKVEAEAPSPTELLEALTGRATEGRAKPVKIEGQEMRSKILETLRGLRAMKKKGA